MAVQANRGSGRLQAGVASTVGWIGWRLLDAWHVRQDRELCCGACWGSWLAVAGGRASNAAHAYMPAATCQAKRTTGTATAMKHCRAAGRHDGGLHQHVAITNTICMLPQCLVLHGTQPTQPSPPDLPLPSAPPPSGPPAGRGSPAAAGGCPAPAYRMQVVPHGPCGGNRHLQLSTLGVSLRQFCYSYPLHSAAAAYAAAACCM